LKTVLIILTLVIVAPNLCAEMLTLEDAIEIGLRNNFDIRIAREQAEISSNNVGRGTAGFLPKLDASGSYTFQRTDQTSNSPNAFGDSDTKSLQAALRLNWTLFDGMKMFSERSRFTSLSKQTDAVSRGRIESSVVEISRAYYNLVQQRQLLQVAEDTRSVSEARLNREEVRRDVGGASSTDYLNAQVSYNNDQAQYLNQRLAVTVAVNRLNLALGRPADTPVDVSDVIDLPDSDITFDEVMSASEQRNSSLLAAQHSLSAARSNVTSNIASFLPEVSLNAGYAYTDLTQTLDRSDVDLETEQRDASIGLELSFNVFNGLQDKIDYDNARAERLIREYEFHDEQNRLNGLVREIFDRYEQRLELVLLEETNVEAASRNLDLLQDKYDLGSATSIEFRDAQVNFQRARTALVIAQFQARIAYLELEQLMGNLLE